MEGLGFFESFVGVVNKINPVTIALDFLNAKLREYLSLRKEAETLRQNTEGLVNELQTDAARFGIDPPKPDPPKPDPSAPASGDFAVSNLQQLRFRLELQRKKLRTQLVADKQSLAQLESQHRTSRGKAGFGVSAGQLAAADRKLLAARLKESQTRGQLIDLDQAERDIDRQLAAVHEKEITEGGGVGGGPLASALAAMEAHQDALDRILIESQEAGLKRTLALIDQEYKVRKRKAEELDQDLTALDKAHDAKRNMAIHADAVAQNLVSRNLA
ncbi:unnamed protein product, partial [marine sediment metagenome]